MPAPKEVAEWMLEQLNIHSVIYQEEIVYRIESNFGEDFIYLNENGNLAIDREVLREFSNLTEGTVVWDRADRFWRWREENDPSGRTV